MSNIKTTIDAITKPKKKSKKSPTVSIDDMQEQVNELNQLKRQMKELKARQDQLLSEVTVKALDALRSAESDGRCIKTVILNGDKSVKVSRKNAFKKIDAEHENTLTDLVGKRAFSQMFNVENTLDLNVDPQVMIDCLEAHGIEVSDFFDTHKFIKPCKSFMEIRAQLRPTIGKTKNEALDALIDAVQYSPNVTFNVESKVKSATKPEQKETIKPILKIVNG